MIMHHGIHIKYYKKKMDLIVYFYNTLYRYYPSASIFQDLIIVRKNKLFRRKRFEYELPGATQYKGIACATINKRK